MIIESNPKQTPLQSAKNPGFFYQTTNPSKTETWMSRFLVLDLYLGWKKGNLNITYVLLYVIVVYLTECLAKTRKVGGSLVVTLPKELVEANKIKEGEIIEISVKKLRKDGFGVLKGVGPFTAQDELTTHD